MTKGRLILIAAIAALAVFLIAFGPAPKHDGTANTLEITMLSSPDSLDPGQSYASEGWSLLSGVYDGLLTYRRAEGTKGNELIPDVAAAMPTISKDGRTYTFKVRTGIHFAPPVNRLLQASDVKYTYDRLARMKTQGPNFFTNIVGFENVFNSGKGSVKGITADNATRTVTFHLIQADPTFIYSMAVDFSGVVPKGTPPHDLSQKGFVPGTGPYMLKTYQPGSQILLVRNPNFKQWSPDLPNGHVDKIHVSIGVSDDNAATRILQGKADFSFNAIPPSKMPFLKQSKQWYPYLHRDMQPLTTYLWMNVTAKPFDNPKVRQAVNEAIDRRAIVKLAGGNGIPTSRLLPSLMPGYPSNDPYPKPDMKKAKQLMAESGVPKGTKVKLWYENQPIYQGYAQYVQDLLNQLGFVTRTQGVDRSSYSQIVGQKNTHAQIGFFKWGADFPEATNFFSVLLKGNPHGPYDYTFFAGEDKEIARINHMTDLKARAAAWGKLDNKVVSVDNVVAPLSGGVQPQLLSKRLGNFVSHPVYDMVFSAVTLDGSGTNNSKTHLDEIGYDKNGAPTKDGGS